MSTTLSDGGEQQPFTLPYAHSFSATSQLGEQFRISVGLPMSYEQSEQSYPVLYVLDADILFCTALEATRIRGALQEISEVIVVGIGYPVGTDFMTYNVRRFHDFSTAEWDLATTVGREFAGMFEALGQQPRLGGLEPLLDLLTEQVQPAVAARYRVDTADQALFGASAGGHFVCQALFRQPGAFRTYIAASPGLCYNDGDVFRREQDYAAANDDLPVALYLSAGSAETLQLANAHVVSDTTRLAEALQLRGYAGLRLGCDVYSAETHVPAATRALHRGLEFSWAKTAFQMTPENGADMLEQLG